MLHVHRILVSAIVLAAGTAALTACGQKGPLFLPTDPGAAQRATLPQIINATLPYGTPVPAPAIPAASAPVPPASTAK
ncbi:MAG: lipoprotein [Pseudomonadota bacterium]